MVDLQVFERRTVNRMPVMLDSLTQTLVAMEQEVQRAVTRLSDAISLTSPYPWPGKQRAGPRPTHSSTGVLWEGPFTIKVFNTTSLTAWVSWTEPLQ